MSKTKAPGRRAKLVTQLELLRKHLAKPKTVRDLAQETDLHPRTIYRLLATLKELGEPLREIREPNIGDPGRPATYYRLPQKKRPKSPKPATPDPAPKKLVQDIRDLYRNAAQIRHDAIDLPYAKPKERKQILKELKQTCERLDQQIHDLHTKLCTWSRSPHEPLDMTRRGARAKRDD